YPNASTTVSARASSANIDSAYFAGYGGKSFGPLNFRSGAALAWHTIGTSRSIAFPGFSEQASARYSAVEGQVFGEIGYGMSFGNTAVEPFAGLAWVYLNTESFNETRAVAALGASGTQDDVNYSTLGARWASTYLMPNGMTLMPRASLAWQHAFGTVTPTALRADSPDSSSKTPRSPSARPIATLEADPPRWTPRALADASASFSAPTYQMPLLLGRPHWPALQDWPRKSGYQTFDAPRSAKKPLGGQWCRGGWLASLSHGYCSLMM